MKKKETRTILVVGHSGEVILPRHKDVDYLKKAAVRHYLAEGHSEDGLWSTYHTATVPYIIVGNSLEHDHTYVIKKLTVI